MRAKSVTATIIAGVCAIGIAAGQTFVPPKLTAYATDLTGTLSRTEIAALNGKLETFAKESSTQVVALLISSIGETSVEEAAHLVAESNGIGAKGKNNGILLLVAKGERKVRIEVGYGLEGALPDALSGTIIRREIVPRFRDGDYYGGISAGVDAIILATRNEYKADEKSSRKRGVPSGVIVAIIVVIIVMSRLFRGGGPFSGSRLGGRRGGMIFFPPIGGGSWRGSSGGLGGGFGGGGFSGGGGSFGGGGASGSW